MKENIKEIIEFYEENDQSVIFRKSSEGLQDFNAIAKEISFRSLNNSTISCTNSTSQFLMGVSLI